MSRVITRDRMGIVLEVQTGNVGFERRHDVGAGGSREDTATRT